MAFLLLTVNPTFVWASEKVAGIKDAKCATDANDPFDPAVMLARGPNKGECLDTSELRSIVLLNESTDGIVTVANFYHAKKFWNAVIDPKKVEKIIFQIENFQAIVPAAHTQLRIVMEKGSEVQLTSQTEKNGLVETTKLREIIFSVEAVKPTNGEQYGLVTGAEQHFGLAYRLASMKGKFQSMILTDHHTVRQYNLKLSAEEKEKVVRNALTLGGNSDYKKFYHTLVRSCTTEAFKVLDQAKNYSFLRELEKHSGSILLADVYPPEASWGLALRGLLLPNGESRMPNLDLDTELIQELDQEGN